MVFQERDEERAQYHRAVFDAVPLPMFIVDSEVGIDDFNSAAEKFLGDDAGSVLHRRGGDAFRCCHAEESGCGQSPVCRACVLRIAVVNATAGNPTFRASYQAEVRKDNGRMVRLDWLVTAGLLPYTGAPKAVLIIEDLTETRKRRGKKSTADLPGSA